MIRENPIRVPRMDERVGDRARLGDPGHAAPRQVRRDVADVGRAVRVEVDDAHAVGTERARDRARARSARPRACIAAAASPPSTTPPPGMMTAGTPAAAAASATGAARSGLRATRTMSGRSGSVVERRIARLAVELVVVRVDEVAAGRAAHHAGGCRGRSRRSTRAAMRRRPRSSAARTAAGGRWRRGRPRAAGVVDRSGVARRPHESAARIAVSRRPARRRASRGPGR